MSEPTGTVADIPDAELLGRAMRAIPQLQGGWDEERLRSALIQIKAHSTAGTIAHETATLALAGVEHGLVKIQADTSDLPTPPAEAGLREAIKEARDLLAERIHGSPARSAGHNARLVLEAALKAQPLTTPAPASSIKDHLPSADWLRRKVETDPDLDAEALTPAPASKPKDAGAAGWKLVPIEPTEAQLDQGQHVNSEWLNDNAPIGEALYRSPAKAVYAAMLAASPIPEAQGGRDDG